MIDKSSRSQDSKLSDALKNASPGMQHYRLYVSAASPLSSRATINARRFLECYLPGQHELSVLDIATNVAQAKLDQVIASPTLVRIHPLPLRRFIGDISDTERLRITLGFISASDEP